MEFDEKLLSLDYLVFSSHKTATQSVARTLRRNGFNCIHCHVLENIEIEDGTFKDFLDAYYLKNQKKLVVINMFREPIERHISSFFQWHAEGVIRFKKVEEITDTIIYKSSISELQKQMIDEINHESIERPKQADESTDHICREFNISISDLNYDPQLQYSLYETDQCKVFFFRFDILTKNLGCLLSAITEKPIKEHSVNIAAAKWYAGIYNEFIASLKIDHNTIKNVYESKRDLINLFYPGEYDRLLMAALEKYGE